MVIIYEKKKVREHIYRDNKKSEYYMVRLEKNSKDEITKISEYISKDLKSWEILGTPYTYTYLKLNGYENMKLEEVYDYMYNKYLKKLDIYDIIDEEEKLYLRG